MRLLDYAANVCSQNGEDGILEKILGLLPVRDKWCVEFGAWDGRHLSNTCNLIEHGGYSAVLIEADEKKFSDLLRNHRNNPSVIALNRCVGFNSDDGLDHILSSTPIPQDFDLLSIDIEGNDYHVWSAVSAYTPKVVLIASNPTIPTEVDFVQPARSNVNQGASLMAITRLANTKGYELICVAHRRAMFVRSVYYPLFEIANNAPCVLREDLSAVTHLFSGYDGTLFVSGRETLPCHNGIRYQARLRQLPRMFRAYPPEFGPLRRVLYRCYRRTAGMFGRA